MWQKIKNYYHLLQAALAALFFNFPSNHIYLIGVTGTDGKTTTVHMLYEILKAAGFKASMISSIYAAIGAKTYDTGLHVTMPGSWQIQKMLRRAVDAGHKYFVLETTSHGLNQNRLAFIKVQIAVLTNITHEHLDYHKNWKQYAQAKFKLFKMAKVNVLNRDDENSYELFSKKLSGKVVSYSLNQQTDYKLRDFRLKLKLPGSYNLANAMAAASAASQIGVNKTKITRALNNFTKIIGRMDKINTRGNFDVYIDFAHTPNALYQALTYVRSQKNNGKSRLIAVFGSAGERDKTKRPLLGRVVDDLADIAVLTSEDPRSENPQRILSEIEKGIKRKKFNENLFKIVDRKDAINFAIQLAKPGDVVILCGKGHEKGMAIKSRETPWDEYETVRLALRKKKNA